MAEYQQRDNSGTLFKNDKDGNESRPDYRGDCMVNGVKMEMSGWIKEGKNGKFLSLAFKEPFAKQEKAKPANEDDPW